jgi:Uma2 family endonuclease
MSAVPHEPLRMTDEEYLAFENASATKHELIDGYIYDMAGGSEDHILISMNIGASLSNQLRKKPCKVYGSDLRVKPKGKGSFFYPDVTVLCGEAKFTEGSAACLLNPSFVVEVLSPSTEAADRGIRAISYREMPSVKAYLFVNQDTAHLELFLRMPNNHWELIDYKGLDAVVDLSVIECTLALEDVYDKVELEEPHP